MATCKQGQQRATHAIQTALTLIAANLALAGKTIAKHPRLAARSQMRARARLARSKPNFGWRLDRIAVTAVAIAV